MDEKEIRVLVVEPQKSPFERKISTLEEMQEIVGGHIEAVYPFPDSVAIVCNESGKMLNLPPNRPLTDDNGRVQDIIHGTFFIAGIGEEDFISLTPEQIQKYSALYDFQPVQERTPVDIMGVFAFPNPDQSKWNIRFIDSDYSTLFTIPDGANITLTRFDGMEETFPCHYIDDTHFEAFGEAWHIFQFAEMMERNGNIYRPEHPRPGDVLDTYEIYQLKDIHNADYWYMPYEYAKDRIRPEHYQRVYTGVLARRVSLETLYNRHNTDRRPLRDRIRSMSVSDIVVLNRDGKRQAFYVNRVGFTECKEFLNPPSRNKPPRKRKNPER